MSKQRESTDKPSAPAHRPLIYLAGPMSGCNAEQKSAWRRALRERYEDRFQFTDPMDTPVDLSANDSRFELAKRDAHAIAGADAVLANMWKESIGTAIGVVTARHAGKIVVVVDKNHLQSTFLAFYADAVAETEGKAMERIDALLKAQRAIEAVTKGDGRREPFNRAKLSGAIRRACATARKNDVLCAAEILPEARFRARRSEGWC